MLKVMAQKQSSINWKNRNQLIEEKKETWPKQVIQVGKNRVVATKAIRPVILSLERPQAVGGIHFPTLCPYKKGKFI